MTSKPNNQDLAIQEIQKFEYYFLALVFTILGLSIQTANPVSSNLFATCAELFSWSMFTISGLVGLSKVEWNPIARLHHHHLIKERKKLNELVLIKKSGSDPSIHGWTSESLQAEIKQLESRIDERNEKKKKIEMYTFWKYRIHRWTFCIGLIVLIISRAIGVLNDV